MSSLDVYLNRRTPEQRALSHGSFYSGDDAQFLNENIRPATAVNHYTSLKYNPVWGAIQRISGDIAKLPCRIITTDPGDKELATDHPTYTVVNSQANENTTAFRFWRTFMFHALLYNRAYAYIERDAAGRCIGLWELPPSQITPWQTTPGGAYDAFRVNWIDGTSSLVPAYAILDVVGMQHDHANQLDTTVLAASNWGTGMAANAFLNQFFSGGNLASGVLEVPAETKQESAVGLVQGLDKALKGLSNAFGTVVLREGAKYHQLSVSPVDSQMVELLGLGVTDVARWFNLPPSELGVDTGGYGNREQDAKKYLDSTLSPWLVNIAQQCRMRLLLEQEKAAYYFEFDPTALLEAEVETRNRVYQMQIQMGVLSPNEVRARLGLNPRDGGDEYFHSNNMQPDSEIDPTDPAADDPDPVEADPEDTEAEADDAVERMWRGEIARVRDNWVKRIKWQRSRRGERFAAWWAESRDATQLRIVDDLALCADVVAAGRDCTRERVARAGLQTIFDCIEWELDHVD